MAPVERRAPELNELAVAFLSDLAVEKPPVKDHKWDREKHQDDDGHLACAALLRGLPLLRLLQQVLSLAFPLLLVRIKINLETVFAVAHPIVTVKLSYPTFVLGCWPIVGAAAAEATAGLVLVVVMEPEPPRAPTLTMRRERSAWYHAESVVTMTIWSGRAPIEIMSSRVATPKRNTQTGRKRRKQSERRQNKSVKHIKSIQLRRTFGVNHQFNAVHTLCDIPGQGLHGKREGAH